MVERRQMGLPTGCGLRCESAVVEGVGKDRPRAVSVSGRIEAVPLTAESPGGLAALDVRRPGRSTAGDRSRSDPATSPKGWPRRTGDQRPEWYWTLNEPTWSSVSTSAVIDQCPRSGQYHGRARRALPYT
jgi:hypothetical protein